MSFHSWFYRSLFVFHALIALCESVATLTLIILVFRTNPELFFKTSHPDDEDWDLIRVADRITILVLFIVGTIRTVILFLVLFGLLFMTASCFVLLCFSCYRKGIYSLFTAKSAHRFFSFNCNCPCYRARPTLRFKLKVTYVIIVFAVRIATIILCLTLRHHITTKSLAVIVAISFFFLLLASLLDYYHYRVWWHYKPHFTGFPLDFAMPTTPLSIKHKRYIPYHLLRDHRTERRGDKSCSAGSDCKNRQLEHIFIFHFRCHTPQPRYFDIPKGENRKNRYIGFHQTDPTSAILIAHSDFMISTEYRSTMLGHGVYFARSRDGTKNKANRKGAFICAEIDMGKVLQLGAHQRNLYRGKNGWWETHDTAYFCHETDPNLDEFCVKSPEQILSWIMAIESGFDKKVVAYGLSDEFEDSKCFCI